MARRRAGNASSMSMPRISTLSVRPATKPATAPMSHADEDRPDHGHEAHDERDPGAVQHAAVDVANVAVEAEEVLRLCGRAAQDMDARRGARLGARPGPARAWTCSGRMSRARQRTARWPRGSRAGSRPTTAERWRSSRRRPPWGCDFCAARPRRRGSIDLVASISNCVWTPRARSGNRRSWSGNAHDRRTRGSRKP